MAIYSGFSHLKLWFSIVMLVYQRVLYQNIMAVMMDREAVSRIGHWGCRRWRQYLEWSGDNGGQWWTMWIYIYVYICFKWISLTKIRWPTTKLGFSLEIKAQKISARIVLAGHFQQQPSKNDCRSSPLVIHVHLRWESLYFTTFEWLWDALSIKRWKTIRV